MTAPDGLSWTCHVCEAERPDSLIGVVAEEGTVGERGIHVRITQRFCRDRASCREQARVQAAELFGVVLAAFEDPPDN